MCMQRTYLDEDTGDWWSDHELAVRAVSFLVSQRESRILLVVGTATARKLAGTQAETARQGVDRLLARGTSGSCGGRNTGGNEGVGGQVLQAHDQRERAGVLGGVAA